jgi:hypothetical protein
MVEETAVEWFYDKIKSHFEHDGDLLESIIFTMIVAKQKERDQQNDFAIGFLDWYGGLRLDEVDNKTTEELLVIYKKEKGL